MSNTETTVCTPHLVNRRDLYERDALVYCLRCRVYVGFRLPVSKTVIPVEGYEIRFIDSVSGASAAGEHP